MAVLIVWQKNYNIVHIEKYLKKQNHGFNDLLTSHLNVWLLSHISDLFLDLHQLQHTGVDLKSKFAHAFVCWTVWILESVGHKYISFIFSLALFNETSQWLLAVFGTEKTLYTVNAISTAVLHCGWIIETWISLHISM